MPRFIALLIALAMSANHALAASAIGEADRKVLFRNVNVIDGKKNTLHTKMNVLV